MKKSFLLSMLIVAFFVIIGCGGGGDTGTSVESTHIVENLLTTEGNTPAGEKKVELKVSFNIKNLNKGKKKAECVDQLTGLTCSDMVKMLNYQKGRLNRIIVRLISVEDFSNIQDFSFYRNGNGEFSGTISITNGKYYPNFFGYGDPVYKNMGAAELLFFGNDGELDTEKTSIINPILYLSNQMLVPLAFDSSKLPGNFSTNKHIQIKNLLCTGPIYYPQLPSEEMELVDGVFRLNMYEDTRSCGNYMLQVSDDDANVINFQMKFNITDITNGVYVTPEITPETSTPVLTDLTMGDLSFGNGDELSFDVKDAVFAKWQNLIIMTSSSPNNSLKLISTWSKEYVESLKLDFVPTALAVSPGGNYAAVGHDAHVSLIDLANKIVAKTFDVPVKVFSIAIADNGFIYASSDKGEIISIESVSGAMSTTNTWYVDKIKMHPWGNYLYGADNFISPMDIRKFDLRNGAVVNMYDSPYHGDYQMCGDIWIDISRVFTKCGNVFSSTDDQGTDMLYAGSLGILIQSMDFSSEKIVAIDGNDTTKIRLFNNNLIEEESVIIPNFVDGSVGRGKFVFINSYGDEFYVISQSDSSGFALSTFVIR